MSVRTVRTTLTTQQPQQPQTKTHEGENYAKMDFDRYNITFTGWIYDLYARVRGWF